MNQYAIVALIFGLHAYGFSADRHIFSDGDGLGFQYNIQDLNLTATPFAKMSEENRQLLALLYFEKIKNRFEAGKFLEYCNDINTRYEELRNIRELTDDMSLLNDFSPMVIIPSRLELSGFQAFKEYRDEWKSLTDEEKAQAEKAYALIDIFAFAQDD